MLTFIRFTTRNLGSVLGNTKSRLISQLGSDAKYLHGNKYYARQRSAHNTSTEYYGCIILRAKVISEKMSSSNWKCYAVSSKDFSKRLFSSLLCLTDPQKIRALSYA